MFDGGVKFPPYYDPKNELVVISSERNDLVVAPSLIRHRKGEELIIDRNQNIYINHFYNGGEVIVDKIEDGANGLIIIYDQGAKGGVFKVKYSGKLQGDNLVSEGKKDSIFEYFYIEFLNKIFIRKIF